MVLGIKKSEKRANKGISMIFIIQQRIYDRYMRVLFVIVINDRYRIIY